MPDDFLMILNHCFPDISLTNPSLKLFIKNIPENKKASLFVYELISKTQIKWAIQEIKTGKDKEITTLNFKTTNYQEFKKVTDKIW